MRNLIGFLLFVLISMLGIIFVLTPNSTLSPLVFLILPIIAFSYIIINAYNYNRRHSSHLEDPLPLETPFVIRCPKCGIELTIHTGVCPQCGTKLPPYNLT